MTRSRASATSPRPATRYEAVTGVAIDHDVVEYQTVLYNALSVVSVGPPLADPVRGTDWISYLAWYVNGARWAFESSPRSVAIELDPVALPDGDADPPRARLRYLVDGMRAAASTAIRRRLRAVALGRIASHLKRVDEIGAAFDADDLAALTELLGHRPDPAEADAELVDFIGRAGPEHEEALVRLLDARVPARAPHAWRRRTSLMLRHPALRSLRPERATARGDDESWPTGAIPGTR